MAQALSFIQTKPPYVRALNWAYRHVFALTVAVALVTPTHPIAKNLGSYGETWAIEEDNLLDVIHKTLRAKEAAGDVDALQRDMTNSTKAYVNRPTPVAGVFKATKSRSFLFDPSITLDQDLKDHRGVIFAHKGQVVNPLEYSSFSKRIVMIDGDDPDRAMPKSW